MELFKELLAFILSLLPKDPFIGYINSLDVPQYVNYVNWFIPVSTFLSIMTFWLAAIAAYYLISVVLRKAGVVS